MPDYPQRKRNRLPDYDYSAPGAYFVTLCTHEKRCFLSKIAVGALHEAPVVCLTEAGMVVRQAINALPERFPEIQIDHSVIMPNHVHLLLQITTERALRKAPLRTDEGGGMESSALAKRALREAPLQPDEGRGRERSTLAKAIGFLKMNSSKQIRTAQPQLKVWQRSFYDYVVRGEDDFREVWTYINNNPARWIEDEYFAES